MINDQWTFIVPLLPFPFRGHQHNCCRFWNQPDVDPVPSRIYFVFCGVFSGNMMRPLREPHRVTRSNRVSHGSHHRPCLAMRCLPTECRNLLAYLRCYDPVLPPILFSFTLLLFQSRDLETSPYLLTWHMSHGRSPDRSLDHLSHDHLIVLTGSLFYCLDYLLFTFPIVPALLFLTHCSPDPLSASLECLVR